MGALQTEIIPSLSVLIIGAGIGGLTAALAFRSQGHSVTIFEKSQFASEVGAAIHVPPNCTVLLKRLGLDPKDFGGTLLEHILRYDDTGYLKHHQDFTEIRKKWLAEWYLVHRQSLHSALKEKVVADNGITSPAILYTGSTITNIDVDNASIKLASGQVYHGDIIIGADGVHSFTRSLVDDDGNRPESTGKSCLRWLVPTSTLVKTVDAAAVVQSPGTFIEWEGPDRRIVAYPCSDNKIFNVCAFLPSKEVGTVTGWSTSGSKDSLVVGFSYFPAEAKRLIHEGDDIKAWELLKLDTLQTWVRGRTALIGDAAHPFQPYMGQGGAMAVEDGVSVAAMFPPSTTRHQVNARLKLYEKARMKRVGIVQDYTARNGKEGNEGRISPTEMIAFMQLLFAHDEYIYSSMLLDRVTEAHGDC